MARNSSFTPYGEHRGRPFDDDASEPEFLAYGSVPAPAAEDDPLAEYPMPLFLSDSVLSDNADEPRPRGFGTGGERI